MQTRKESGFSLIELSIVLVIIGLLVAGITGGSSLIRSAEMRSVVAEIRNYQTAVNAYYTAENMLPGDGIRNPSENDGRNENGRIEAYNGSAYEGELAWSDMVDIGILDVNVSPSGDGKFTPGGNIPRSRLKGGGWFFDYYAGVSTETGLTSAMNSNVLVLTGAINTAVTTAGPVNAVKTWSAKTIKFIDDKIDDGRPLTGSLRSLGTADNCEVDGDQYNVSGTIDACSMAVRVGL